MSLCFVLKAAEFTMSLELISSINSIGTKLFAFKVFPVSTSSTMQSDHPTIGASTIAP